jgi:uncharacterized coiled-coil protein SlyX
MVGKEEAVMATVEERVFLLEKEVAVQLIRIDGLAKESTMTQMFADMRADMAHEFADLRKDIQSGFTQANGKVAALDTRLAMVETRILSMPGTANMYLAIGGALLLGLGGAFAMFKYMVSLIH